MDELEQFDAEITFVKNGFTHAARSTDVETAIIKVAFPEPKVHESDIFSRLTKDESIFFDEEEKDSCEMLPYEFVENLVQNYNLEIKLGIELYREYRALAPHILEDFEDERDDRKKNGLPSNAMLTISPSDPNEYIKAVRKKYWSYALRNPEVYGRLTSELQREWRNRVDEMAEYDFTVFNIKEVMLEMMNQVAVGVNDAILSYFDQFTRYAQYDGSENVHYYNGWKTNKAYKVNKKIIMPCWGAINNRDWSSDYGKLDVYEASRILSDVEKVFAYLDDGSSPSVDLFTVLQWAYQDGKTRKIQTKFFEVSFFKKGTMHIVFHDQRLLDAFNIYGARKRNWLPETYGVKTYDAMDEEEQAVIDSFQGKEAYEKVMENKQFYLQEPAAKQLSLMSA